jgi:hypothetical protein
MSSAPAKVRVRAMTAADWTAVRAIYEAGIATGHATFETSAPGWQQWNASHLVEHRLVAVVDDEIAGWTALSPVSVSNVTTGGAVLCAEHGYRRRGGSLLTRWLGRPFASRRATERRVAEGGIRVGQARRRVAHHSDLADSQGAARRHYRPVPFDEISAAGIERGTRRRCR